MIAAVATPDDWPRTSPVACALAWEHRAYRDFRANARLDLDDPVERAAITLYRFKYETPAAAVGAVTSAAEHLNVTWRALEPCERQVWRRRAATIILVADVAGEAAAHG